MKLSQKSNLNTIVTQARPNSMQNFITARIIQHEYNSLKICGLVKDTWSMQCFLHICQLTKHRYFDEF